MQSFDYKNSSYLSAMINSSVKKSNQYKNSYYIWNSYFRNSLLGQFDLKIGVANVAELPRENSKKYLFTYFLSVKTLTIDKSTCRKILSPNLLLTATC